MTPQECSLTEFIRGVYPEYSVARLHKAIIDKLEQIELRQIDRLMIFVPPRHGKSLLTSIYFPAWFLGRNPDLRIIHSSYSSKLTHRFSRTARNLLKHKFYKQTFPLVKVAQDSRSVEAWDIEGRRGGLLSAGVGGSITGHGGDLIIIDDPIKSAAEATSQCIRENLKEWYRHDLRTRLEKNGRIVICQTRWHEDDLCGWLLKEASRDGEKWNILHLPALNTHGEPLWPEKYDFKELKAIRKTVGTYAWEALYQGKPVPKGGLILQRAWFKTCLHYDVPKLKKIIMGVDLAVSTKTSADYTVALPVGVDEQNRYYIFRPYRARSEWPVSRREIIARARGAKVSSIGIEKVAFQNAAIQDLRREQKLTGISVVASPTDTDKVSRVIEWSPIAEQGNIYLVDDNTGWHETFLKECESFPRGNHDDQVDALGIAIRLLRKQNKILEFF